MSVQNMMSTVDQSSPPIISIHLHFENPLPPLCVDIILKKDGPLVDLCTYVPILNHRTVLSSNPHSWDPVKCSVLSPPPLRMSPYE